ncbi:hypothetical protein [Psychrobacillus psychrotolerans]|uniref:hypothetical protein n=1 Tax=Psychrobacillus psychrotolerans TaxID=126156 RepID=UPI003B02C0AB
MLLFTSKNEETPTLVERQLFIYDDLTSEEKIGSIEVEKLPEFENNGKLPQLHINKDTKEMWYEYIEMPKSETELINDKLDNAILELTTLISMGGM